jgi:hypothetical protein
MATRRVKRIKRTKKQVQHGRRKTSRHRYTRRQRGGKIMTVCEKTGLDMIGTAKGIAITYNTDSQKYTIGNHPYGKLTKMPRYIDALASLEVMHNEGSAPQPSDNEFVVLDQDQFDRFKQVHCQGAKQECQEIRGFSVPSDSAASAAPVAAGPTDYADILREMNMNELKVTEQIIAFKNNNGVVVHYPADISKRECNFENFAIPTSSNGPITGALKVTFRVGSDKKLLTDFTLELKMSSITPELLECMKNIEKDPNVVINSTTSTSSKLTITGTLLEKQHLYKKISTFDLNGFVQKFMKQYESCSDIATQMAQMRVAGPTDVALVIRGKIDMISNRINKMSKEEKTKFETLKQQFTRADRTTDLALLNQISTEMDKLAQDRRDRIYSSSGQVVSSSVDEKLARLLEMDKD